MTLDKAPDDTLAPTPQDLMNGLTPEVERVLEAWREALVLQNPKLNSKALFALGLRAVQDPAFRRRLVEDSAAVLAELPPTLALPEGVSIAFHDTGGATEHVVLPPPAASIAGMAEPLRDALRSRTGERAFLRDDFDVIGLEWKDLGMADADTRDPPIFQPAF